MKMQGLPTFSPRVNMTNYERKYMRLRQLTKGIGGDAPYYRLMFYLNYDKRHYRLIKETKIHYYFISEGKYGEYGDIIIRVAKKSMKTYMFFPSYGTETVPVVMFKKENE